MKKYTLLSLIVGCFLFGKVTIGFAQNKIVKGTVTDNTGGPLLGVNIGVKGATTGTTTGNKGHYNLTVPSLQDTLIFSFIGYQTQIVPINGRNTINITLKTNVISGKEMVVIGYGKQAKENVTTSISKLNDKVLKNVPFDNPQNALQGTIPGVRVQRTSGQPGAEPRVIVRGGTSINNPNGAHPLYVVDGIIREDMNNISSSDIKSIQVLKDAAATAIYGARGSNGVVVVTTKSGKAGETRVSYSMNVGFSEPSKLYDLANAEQYLRMTRGYLFNSRPGLTDVSSKLKLSTGFGTGNDLTKNTAYTTQYLTPDNKYLLNQGWESMPDPADPSKKLIFKDTDFQNVLFRKAFTQKQHLAISGGSDNATFRATASYLNDKGIGITTGSKKYNLGLKGKVKVNDWLNLSARSYYTTRNTHSVPNITNIFARGMTLPPTTKYRFLDGTIAPGQARNEGNPAYYLHKHKAGETRNYLTIIFSSQMDILPGLTFKPQMSLYTRHIKNHSFWPKYLDGVGSPVDSRDASFRIRRFRKIQSTGTLNYNKSFLNLHNINVVLGFQFSHRENSSYSASAQGGASDLIRTLNASPEPINVGSSITNRTLIGYFGRINYNYKERYLFSVDARYDGASNLGKANQWGFFPGISVGWNVDQEKFWNLKQLIKLKLRASYGITGNIGNLGDFAAQGVYSVGSKYNGIAAIQNTVLPNPDLKWEHSKTLDLGTDIKLFKDRIGLTFDAYRRVTKHLITTLKLPPSSGFSSILTNLGSLENKGIEVAVNTDLFPIDNNFQWNLSVNAAYVKSTILKLPDNGAKNNRIGGVFVWNQSKQKYTWEGGLQEGHTMGDYFNWKELGVYKNDQAAANAPVDKVATVDFKQGGDTKWADIDHNGIIDSRDQVYLGNQYPDWTGGISSTFSYKTVSLYVRANYMFGHTIFNYGRAFMDGSWKLNMNLTEKMVKNAWKQPGDITKFPYYGWESVRQVDNLNPGRPGQRYYEKGNYLAIREVTLSYELPKPILAKTFIKSLRLSISGKNLHYFTHYDGLNPEYGGRDYGRYPIPRTFLFGLNLTF
jgi:TonB-linked SusC/RagA family outer membrane protein